MDLAAARLTYLWVEHGPALHRYLRRMGASDAADDLVSEVFTVAWRRLKDVPEADEARLWLFTVARNAYLTHFRGERRRYALAEKVASIPAECSESAEQIALERVALKGAWYRLSDSDREVIALIAWEGLTNEQAARLLGCRTATLAVRLARARRRLLDALERQDSISNADGAIVVPFQRLTAKGVES